MRILIALSVNLLFFSVARRSLNIFLALFNNPRSYNLDLIHRLVLCPSLYKPNPLYNPQATLHPPKNRMLPIQPWRRSQRNKKLTSVCILSTIRHAQNPRACMFQPRIYLIFELFTINRSTTTPSAGRIASLQHEVWNDAVEDDVVVVAALGEGGEVVACLKKHNLSV